MVITNPQDFFQTNIHSLTYQSISPTVDALRVTFNRDEYDMFYSLVIRKVKMVNLVQYQVELYVEDDREYFRSFIVPEKFNYVITNLFNELQKHTDKVFTPKPEYDKKPVTWFDDVRVFCKVFDVVFDQQLIQEETQPLDEYYYRYIKDENPVAALQTYKISVKDNVYGQRSFFITKNDRNEFLIVEEYGDNRDLTTFGNDVEFFNTMLHKLYKFHNKNIFSEKN